MTTGETGTGDSTGGVLETGTAGERAGASPAPGVSARVVLTGYAPVKGSRWRWADEVLVDAGGVLGDRQWAAVDDRGHCLRTMQHPELITFTAPDASQLAADVAGAPGEDATVNYWGRDIEATVHRPPCCVELTRLTGVEVRLAFTTRRPGFIWRHPVSVLLASEIVGLPGGPSSLADTAWRLGAQLARYRPNLVVDDLAAPLRPEPGGRLVVEALPATEEGQPVRLAAGCRVTTLPATHLDASHSGDASAATHAIPLQLVLQERLERCVVVNHNPASGRQDTRTFQELPDLHLGWGCTVVSA